MEGAVAANRTWHGRFTLLEEGFGYWRIGPFEMWATRSLQEWRLGHRSGDDSLDDSLEVEVPAEGKEPPEGAKILRFGFREPPEAVSLTPTLADRPVVVSPESPLLVPPGEAIVLYLSTPLWVQVTIGEAGDVLLDEPTHRPTDTWFGPSTMSGELCYATRTAARLNFENVAARPHRVVTAAEISNTARGNLKVEKLRIPTPQMSVFVSDEGKLWTETVAFDRRDEDEMASVQLGKRPPAVASSSTLLRGPRSPFERGLVLRAFGGLLR